MKSKSKFLAQSDDPFLSYFDPQQSDELPNTILMGSGDLKTCRSDDIITFRTLVGVRKAKRIITGPKKIIIKPPTLYFFFSTQTYDSVYLPQGTYLCFATTSDFSDYIFTELIIKCGCTLIIKSYNVFCVVKIQLLTIFTENSPG